MYVIARSDSDEAIAEIASLRSRWRFTHHNKMDVVLDLVVSVDQKFLLSSFVPACANRL